MTYRAVSLFSGCGGMDVGAKKAGFTTIAASELNKHACSTFRKNHPNVELIEGDIDEKMDDVCKYDDIDLVFGGPPCQGFSVAGKMSPDDPRSKLVFSFCNVVERVNPQIFVLENVKALGLLAKFESVRSEIIKRMSAAGYTTSFFVLNSRDYGVPQNRERVFFIGTKANIKPVKIACIEQQKSEALTLREAICHLGPAGSQGNPNITKAKITLAAKPIMRRSPYAGMMFNGQGRPLNPDAWSSTLPASMGGNRTPIIDEDHLYDNKPSWVEEYHAKLVKGETQSVFTEAPKRLRRMTIDEAAIIQTFPADYVFEGPQSSVFSQIGNAVPCKLAAAVFSAVRQSLDENGSIPLQSRFEPKAEISAA
jgi:DNA (cytosine-5)-methyltransferase 1